MERYTVFEIRCDKMKTTINFSGDLKMNADFKNYTSEDKFEIVKKLKNGKYLLKDYKWHLVTLPKRNLNCFQKPEEKQ